MKGTAFSRALRDARKEKGWTRLQAYMKSLEITTNQAVTPDSLQKWETGEQIPMSIERVVVLARLYRMPELIEIRLKECEGYAELKILSSTT